MLVHNYFWQISGVRLPMTQSVSNSFGSMIPFGSYSSVFNFAKKFSEFHLYKLNRFLPHLISIKFQQKSFTETETSENDWKVESNSYCCLASTRTFPGSYLSRNYGNGNIADNFFSPNTVDFNMQISNTVRLEITATPQAGNFFTATPHKKIRNTATPQIPNVPLFN